ncbi:MAG: FRG domain-containing protein [Campylobacterales bacterium]
MSVKNIQEFMDELTKIQKSSDHEKNRVMLYRGHEIETWKLTPSLYRNKAYPLNEHKYINDAIIDFPNDLQVHETNFEKLAFLQHYGIPTRVLDLTQNPLVALYFACLESGKTTAYNASVEVLNIDEGLVKYYNSDSVSVLSAFSRLSNEKLIEIRGQFKESITTNSNKTIVKLCDHHSKAKQRQGLLEKFSTAYGGLNSSVKYEIDMELNKSANIGYLYHEIKYEKPQFEKKIRLEDYDNRILCVKTKMSDARIQAQQGMFLLFGIYNSDKKELPKINSVKYSELIKNKKIIIDKSSKKTILAELNMLGINKQRLFPDFSYSGKTILDKYK